MLGANEIFVQFNLINSVQKITAAQFYERTNVFNVIQTTEHGGIADQLEKVNANGPRPSCNVSQVWFHVVGEASRIQGAHGRHATVFCIS